MRLHPGEVEATGWSVEPLAGVVRRLHDASPGVRGRPRVVAVDGRGGAGKTTLVQRLGRVVASGAVVHTDDVAWNHACFDWAGLLVEHVLRPLHRGEGVRWTPPAWRQHGRPGAIEVPAGLDVVWVEGSGSIRRELAGWVDASIWVQGDLDLQERRLRARDGDGPEQRRQVAEWMAEELPFMLREQPWARATVVVAGDSALGHDPEAQVVVAGPPPASQAGPGEDPGATSVDPRRL